MDFSIKMGSPENQYTECLVLPIFEDIDTFSFTFNDQCNKYIKKLFDMGDISGKIGTSINIHMPPIPNIDRILLIGCGNKSHISESDYFEVIKCFVESINKTNSHEACCFLTMLHIKYRSFSWKIKKATQIAADIAYNFDKFKSNNKKNKKKALKKIIWFINGNHEINKCQYAMTIGLNIAKSMAIAKDLSNTPPNKCNPTFMAQEANKFAKKHKTISFKVLNKKDIQSLNMGAYLSVTQGSVQPLKFIIIEYKGKGVDKLKPPYIFVGKGITFDTGGISLKPADKMIGMKFDMCGAAAVLGIIKFVAEMNLPINVIGIMVCAENMPSGQATRPDDVVTTMSGQTVEIINTDAEGRLILCDALTYCEKFKPKVVIDIATLTGASVVALGSHYHALLSNNQTLANTLIKAGEMSADKCWQLPISNEYFKQLDSNIADFTNVGGLEAGCITAACFLSKFTSKYNWAHLDIAGTSYINKDKNRVATGRPVPMLAEYLLDVVNDELNN